MNIIRLQLRRRNKRGPRDRHKKQWHNFCVCVSLSLPLCLVMAQFLLHCQLCKHIIEAINNLKEEMCMKSGKTWYESFQNIHFNYNLNFKIAKKENERKMDEENKITRVKLLGVVNMLLYIFFIFLAILKVKFQPPTRNWWEMETCPKCNHICKFFSIANKGVLFSCYSPLFVYRWTQKQPQIKENTYTQ